MLAHQVSGRPRHVLGSFQFAVPVATAPVLLRPEISKLSVLRHIQRGLEPEDPWRAVFTRYLDLVARRVNGFGGNADRVEPSPAGTGVDEAALPCRRRARVFAGLLALLVVMFALHPLPGYLGEILVGLGFAAAAANWRVRCAPSRCAVTAAVISGLAVGAGVVGILWLLGVTGTLGAAVLAVAGAALAVAVLLTLRWRCFSSDGTR